MRNFGGADYDPPAMRRHLTLAVATLLMGGCGVQSESGDVLNLAVQNDSGAAASLQMAEFDPGTGPGSLLGEAVTVEAGASRTVALPIPEKEPWIVLINGEGAGSLHSIGLADARSQLGEGPLKIDVRLLPGGQTNISIDAQ